MIILGIETSCDETSAAIVKQESNGSLKLLSNVVSSSLPLHAKTGGIIPEIAAREQIKYIIPVISKAIEQSNNGTIDSIDAIAVTFGPGLMGSLLVGVETARTLSFVFNKPLIPVNHLIGHIYANFIGEIHNSQFIIHNSAEIEFPLIALVVSGGHTDLILMKKHGNIVWLGGTRDDAAGEAFDKIGRLLGLPYPGGPAIEKAALNGDPKNFDFPRPMIDSNDFDFSFSGLKTAVLREVQTMKQPASPSQGGLNNETINDISASVQKTIVDVLIKKTLDAAQKFNVKSILLGGGVATNQKLRDELNSSLITHHSSLKLFVPTKSLCTDNGAMIAAAAFFNFKPQKWQKLSANPELYFD